MEAGPGWGPREQALSLPGTMRTLAATPTCKVTELGDPVPSCASVQGLDLLRSHHVVGEDGHAPPGFCGPRRGEEKLGPQILAGEVLGDKKRQKFPWGKGGLWIGPEAYFKKGGTLGQVGVGARLASGLRGGPNWGDNLPALKTKPTRALKGTPRQEVVGKGHPAGGPPTEKMWPLPHPTLSRKMETYGF